MSSGRGRSACLAAGAARWLVGGLALLCACGADGAEGATVKLGVLLPYTGEASALSANLEKGSLLAVEQINRVGGVGGVPAEIVFGNTFSDPERAAREARALVEQGVVAVVGPGGDEGVEAIFRELEPTGVPLFSPLASASAGGVGSAARPWFRMAPTTRVLGENLAKIVGEIGTTRLAAVIANDAYHAELGGAFLARIERYASLDMVARFDEKTADFERLSRMLAERLAAGTQGIMLAMHPLPAARLATELAALRGSDAPPQWFLTPRLKTDVLVQNASPGALEGAIGIAPEVFAGTRGEFEAHFLERSGDLPLDPTFYVYDATAVTLIAIDRAIASGQEPPAGIAPAIDHVASFGGRLVHWDELGQARRVNLAGLPVQYTGLTGPVILREGGARSIGTSSLWRVEAERVVVESPAARERVGVQ